ncbi:hypothetical protein BOTBODRAFT_175979 [Botryobasidium botryosum FD-172 SS1]|uniref:Ubiquitin-like protease family profile domain-containing protein n=1 Tax=Botryobasidium botryosum (strain FD-172 SS1) TaxID=930990 RepID=A0A067MMR1_BOTB1|nr:hypothetical protein BOTBODRAFT_175979 [Botryobasidium botryosum FD-172 SS1]
MAYQLQRRIEDLHELSRSWCRTLSPFDPESKWLPEDGPAPPTGSKQKSQSRASPTPAAPRAPEYDSLSHSSQHTDMTSIPDENDPVHDILDELANVEGVYEESDHEDDNASLAAASVPSPPRCSPSPSPCPSPSPRCHAPLIETAQGRGTPIPLLAEESARSLGLYWCTGEDVARLSVRTAWLTGAAISLFAELRVTQARERFNQQNTYHLPASLTLHIDSIVRAQAAQDTEKVTDLITSLSSTLQRVPSPQDSHKWLIPAHVPDHWTLLEVRWDTQELRHYDSLPNRTEAVVDARGVEIKARVLLQIMRDWFCEPIQLDKWVWVGEQREERQHNTFDCGAFISADLVSLAEEGIPSRMVQADMKDWRARMLQELRELPIHSRKNRPLIPPHASQVIELD